jgi:hypothetical protein
LRTTISPAIRGFDCAGDGLIGSGISGADGGGVFVAIIGKWLIAGNLRPGRYPYGD